MDAFKAFWNANTLLIGIGMSVLALVLAVLRMGQAATVAGLLGGIAFMWMGKPDAPRDDEEETA
jgi:hypothetical protein